MYWWWRIRWRDARRWLLVRLWRSLEDEERRDPSRPPFTSPLARFLESQGIRTPAGGAPSSLELPPPEHPAVLVPVRSHVESVDCWCRPKVYAICPSCGGDPAERSGCWQCAGAGEVPYAGGWTDWRLHVVHNAWVPGR